MKKNIFILKGIAIWLSLFTSIAVSDAQDAKLAINAGSVIRTIPDDLYGYNGTIWDGAQNGSNASYNNLLKNAGFKIMRWPGGSWGDAKAWNNTQCDGTWIVSYDQSKSLYSSLGIKFQPIVNFSGYWCSAQHTSAEANALAASWVSDGALGATYWEVGNEIMGSWEQGYTNATDYGNRFADFYKAMKAKNGNIKIIAVGDQHPENNWTQQVLSAAKAKGVTPDGWQIHNYPGSGGNVQLLHGDLDAIATWTSQLNSMVGTGKAYTMTEFGASGNDRWIKQIGAQLALQYIMEMAKNNWAVSNVFGEIYNTTTFAAAPVWYVYGFLYGKFGRDLVAASSNNGDVRTYASKTSDGALTIWVCNNATSSKTAQLSISGFTPSSAGTAWVMEGANGGGEEAYDIAINGTLHPSEANVRSMGGNSIATGSSFTITCPKSSMTLIRLTAGSSGCTPTAITPYLQVNGGTWTQAASASLSAGGTVIFGPQPTTGGSWKWSGPNSFSSTSREVTLSNIQSSQAGNYVATYTNAGGCSSVATFAVTISGSAGSTIVSGSTYQIIARHSSKTLGIIGASTTDGALLEQRTYSGGPNQQFIITDLGSGNYRISPASSTGKGLDVSAWSTVDGGSIDQWTFGGGTNQQWQFVANGSYYNIKSLSSAKCLDVNAASTADGATVVQWTCGTATNQQFSLTSLKSAKEDLTLPTAVDGIFIYPNPFTTGKLNIELNGMEGITSVSIVDLSGHVFKEQNINGSSITMELNLRPGIYLIQLVNNHKTVVKKLTVK